MEPKKVTNAIETIKARVEEIDQEIAKLRGEKDSLLKMFGYRPSARQSYNKTGERLLGVMDSVCALTAKELAKRAEIDRSSIYPLLYRLMAQGKVEKTTEGAYKKIL